MTQITTDTSAPVSNLTDDMIEAAIGRNDAGDEYTTEDVRHVLETLNQEMARTLEEFRVDAENIVYEDENVLVYDDFGWEMMREVYIDAGLEQHVRRPDDRMRDVASEIMEWFAEDTVDWNWRDSHPIVVEKDPED